MEKSLIGCSEFVLALSQVKRWGSKRIADYVIKHNYDLNECLDFLELELEPSDFAVYKNGIEIARKDLKDNEEKHIKSISLFDKEFPKELSESKDPVVHLFYVGDISLLYSRCVTIIGTRKPDEEFSKKGYKVAHFFASRGFTVVSGLAIGCDSIAHRATLDAKGKTIAILPCALDQIIPTQNRGLAREIVKSGGLVMSEYSVNSTMNKFNFPQRDRIQSIISNVAIVIQSSESGGTMIAVRKSINEGKKVFAIEGNNLSIISKYFNPNNIEELEKIVGEI